MGPQNTTVTVVTADGEGRILSQTRHLFHGRRDGISDPVSGAYGIHGRELQTQVLDGGLLRTEDKTWQARGAGAVVTEETTTLDDGQEARKVYDYDEFNNRISSVEYAFDGSPLRRNCARFLKGSEYTGIPVHLVRLPLREAVYEHGGGDVECTAPGAAMTTYAYDGEPLTDRPGITGHDGAFGPGYATRGNVTAVSKWLSTGGGLRRLRRRRRRFQSDGRGYQTSRTTIAGRLELRARPAVSGGHESIFAHVVRGDFATGLPSSSRTRTASPPSCPDISTVRRGWSRRPT
jgi:hypothetical protein